MSAIATITNTLTSSPLPLLIEKLGMAVANAQAALDRNSIAVANELSVPNYEINGKTYSLLSLGFVPTFYAFTEASIEAKLEFHLAESTDFAVGAQVGAQIGVVSVNVSASYARKFEMSASGSSSIAARLVSLPVPDRYMEVLKQLTEETPIPVTKVTIIAPQLTMGTGGTLQLTVSIEPTNPSDNTVTWSLATTPTPPAGTTISQSGLLTAGGTVGSVKVLVKSNSNPTVTDEEVFTIS